MTSAQPDSPWMPTHSGKIWRLLDPRAADVDWRDIAIALGRCCRFGGHTQAYYSVAQHSRLAAGLVEAAIRQDSGFALLRRAALAMDTPPIERAIMDARRCDETARRLTLAVLLHDAHEAYIGDAIRPVGAALANLSGSDEPINLLKRIQDAAIFEAAGLAFPFPTKWDRLIHLADLIMLATERRDIAPAAPFWDQPLPPPSSRTILPEAESIASSRFLDHLKSLLPAPGAQAVLSAGLEGGAS